MPKQQLEQDTQKILSEGEKLSNFVESDAWKLIRKKLFDKLITIDSIAGVPKDKKTNEEIIFEIKLREGVVSLILQWIREIEGSAKKYKFDSKMFEDIRRDSIIQYFE